MSRGSTLPSISSIFMRNVRRIGKAKRPRVPDIRLTVFSVSMIGTALFYQTDYLGVWMGSLSVLLFLLSRQILLCLLSANYFLLSIAFDYYIRVRPNFFLFYDGSGITVEYLAIVCLIPLGIVFFFDAQSNQTEIRYAEVPVLSFRFNAAICIPASVAIILRPNAAVDACGPTKRRAQTELRVHN